MSDEQRREEPARFKVVPPEKPDDVPVPEEPEGEDVRELREKSNKITDSITKTNQIVDTVVPESLLSLDMVNGNLEKMVGVKNTLEQVQPVLDDSDSEFCSSKVYLSVHDSNFLLSALELYEKIKSLRSMAPREEELQYGSSKYKLVSVMEDCMYLLNKMQERLSAFCYLNIRFSNSNPYIVGKENFSSGEDREKAGGEAFEKIKPLFEILQKSKNIQVRNELRGSKGSHDLQSVVLDKVLLIAFYSNNSDALHLALSHMDDLEEWDKQNLFHYLQPVYGGNKPNTEIEARIREYKRTEAFGDLMAQLPDLESLIRFIDLHVDKIAIEHTTQEYDYHNKEYLINAILELIKVNTFSSDLQNKGMEEAYEVYKEKVRRMIEAKLSGSIKEMRHPLTRHVGDFNLRETVSGHIKKEMIDEASFFLANERNFNLAEALEKGWISTIWYFQRTFQPEQTITAVIKIDDVDTIVNTTGKELLEYIENRPRGVKDEKLDKIIEYLKEHEAV
ncbi:MAG TPA: hypothetical protein DEB09_05655 [Candidatus Magasanikbacteria bacterium]|nr:hypothetical protein [Candidatus Magasanikbacteria bacterium]